MGCVHCYVGSSNSNNSSTQNCQVPLLRIIVAASHTQLETNKKKVSFIHVFIGVEKKYESDSVAAECDCWKSQLMLH